MTFLVRQSHNTDIFSNQLIRFYSIKTRQIVANLTFRTVRRVVPQHRDRNVTTDYCDVTLRVSE